MTKIEFLFPVEKIPHVVFDLLIDPLLIPDEFLSPLDVIEVFETKAGFGFWAILAVFIKILILIIFN